MGFHDMIVLACWRPTLCGARDRAFSGGKLLAGNVYWAHSGEHLWWVREEKEGRYLLWVPKERRDLLWVPLADHCGGLREESLPWLLMDLYGI